MEKVIAGCSSCGYPLATTYIGQVETCPMCSTVNESISEGVSIPTPLIIGIIALGLGIFIGLERQRRV